MELYVATGNNKYKERAFALAELFKSEFVYTADNCLLWHYFPEEYYRGWSVDDNISVNTPSQVPSIDNLYEDVSHAGWNISFVVRFNELFPEEIFSDTDIDCLKNTLNSIRYGERYLRFISGDVAYQLPKVYFRSNFGWTALADSILIDEYSKGMMNRMPFFDRSPFTIYTALLEGK